MFKKNSLSLICIKDFKKTNKGYTLFKKGRQYNIIYNHTNLIALEDEKGYKQNFLKHINKNLIKNIDSSNIGEVRNLYLWDYFMFNKRILVSRNTSKIPN